MDAILIKITAETNPHYKAGLIYEHRDYLLTLPLPQRQEYANIINSVMRDYAEDEIIREEYEKLYRRLRNESNRYF